MQSALRVLPHYTYDDYLQWEGRWEIIGGVPYAMSPAPVPQHQFIATDLVAEFRAGLKNTDCRDCKATIYLDYVVADDIILQPDVLIVCGNITKKFLDFPPALVVEILSPSTAMKDRNNKFIIYESQKIPWYLIVDPDVRTIEIYKLNEAGKYMQEKFDAALPYRFTLKNDCTIDVTLTHIWQ
jgi:Uma2 family endonuclease